MKDYIDFLKKYVSNYDKKDKGIKVKYEHSLNVYKNAKEFIKEHDFSKQDEKLILFIALFHDIGRFEQIKIYETMQDSKSIDHGELGCEVLKNENLLKDFSEEEQNIILISIANHNKKEIKDGLSDRELLHLKIIRDLDKLDIYRIYFKYYYRDYDGSEIENEFFEKIMNNGKIEYDDVFTTTDFNILKLTWLYDINYPYIMKKIYDKGYVWKLLSDLPSNGDGRSEIIGKKIIDYVNSYIENS
jgi:putative nucleotidyltransferase with HDIG domain